MMYAEMDESMVDVEEVDQSKDKADTEYRPFTLKRWNACAMWAWDVECDTCAICRVQLMEDCLKCQTESSKAPSMTNPHQSSQRIERPSTPPPSECVVVWGDCSHSFHNCCMAQWVKQNARCPLCQQDWVVQRIGK